jgi:hypothetical protein
MHTYCCDTTNNVVATPTIATSSGYGYVKETVSLMFEWCALFNFATRAAGQNQQNDRKEGRISFFDITQPKDRRRDIGGS